MPEEYSKIYGINIYENLVQPNHDILAQASESSSKATGEKPSKRQARMTNLDTDKKNEILAMTKPSDMDPEERKRQYSSLRRAIYREAPAPLVAKFQLCSDAERLFSSYSHAVLS